MTNALSTRGSTVHGSSKVVNGQQIADLALLPSLYDEDLGAVLSSVMPATSGGTFDRYPLNVSFLIGGPAARITASLPEAAKLVHRSEWPNIRRNHERMGCGRLPTDAPAYEHTDRLVQRLSADADAMSALSDWLTRSGIDQAAYHGNFAFQDPDFTRPDLEHTVFGDGTYIKRYSAVEEVIDLDTGQKRLDGTRVPDSTRSRRQTEFTFSKSNGKSGYKYDGINHVSIHTRTPYGKVILGAEQAMGAEAFAMLALCERLMGLMPGDLSLHHYSWDGAASGWHRDFLMYWFGVNLLNGNPARNTRGEESFVRALDQVARETAVALKGSRPDAKEIAHIRGALLKQLEPIMDELELGSTIEPQRGSLAAIDSAHVPYKVLEHPGHPDCRHDLHVDHGVMYEVNGERKLRRVRAVRSVRERAGNGFHQRTTWDVPCARHGAFEHASLWRPNAVRGTDPRYRKKRGVEQTALHAARVPAPGDEGYRMHYQQSAQEGYHRWIKNQLYIHGRASSWRPGKQFLDFISSALVNNSSTWQRSVGAAHL